MSTQLLERPTLTDPETETGEPKVAHLVAGADSGARVTEAYVMGTPLTALCGFVFVPTRDPKKFPMCPECRDIAQIMGADL